MLAGVSRLKGLTNEARGTELTRRTPTWLTLPREGTIKSPFRVPPLATARGCDPNGSLHAVHANVNALFGRYLLREGRSEHEEELSRKKGGKTAGRSKVDTIAQLLFLRLFFLIFFLSVR